MTETILAGAIEVHRFLGPGLLESAYRACLVRELELRGLEVQQEVAVPICFKGIQLECSYRADLVVANAVVLELKAVDHLLPIHEAQLLTHLKLLDYRVGLLLNFNAAYLRQGIKKLVN
ncbi:GxxExxY protein [Usitatibacter rugosus]|nr:GxxExxY protein [Usitatibacter rugosus]